MSSCLILIDLQNEFLSPGGNFPIHESSRQFIENVRQVINAFRSAGNCIFWIRSEYDNKPEETVPTLDNFLSGTHTGRKRCCEKGGYGAQFPEDIAELIKESAGDIVITKSWYSAFKETSLLSELKQRGITKLSVGGLVTNVCVQATAVEAIDLGLDVIVLEDCVGWRNRTSHQTALGNMRELGIRVTDGITSKPAPPVEPMSAPAPPDLRISTLYYVNGSIPSWRVLMVLYEKGVRFEGKRLKVMSYPKETRSPAFLALNHRGKTPVFVDVIAPPSSSPSHPPSTVTINESLAILYYLETYHNPDVPLLPQVSNRAARALVLARIQETENLHHAYDALEDAHFSATDKSTGGLSDSERIQLVHDIQCELDFWEVYAVKTVFIAGDQFSLADCAFFPLLAYMVHRGFDWRRATNEPEVDGNKLDGVGENGAKGKGKHKAKSQEAAVDAWPNLRAYFERVWNRNGEDGCAQRAQPDGWNRRGKANVWKGTKGNSKPRRTVPPGEMQP